MDELGADDLAAWLREQVEANLDQWRRLASAYTPGAERVGDVLLHEAREQFARCEAELAILGEHGDEHMCFENTHDGNTWDYHLGDCRIMRQLGSGYRHRSGYKEEWKFA
jgi:Family of unknown function (DUF6221)